MAKLHDRTTSDDSDSGELPQLAVDEVARSLARSNIHARLFGSDDRELIADRFEIASKLGSGGMSSVWRAHDLQLERTVALKFMLPLDPDARDRGEQRLLREAQALARVSHPNVIPVFDFGTHEGRVWIAMEHVPGRTLRELDSRECSPRARLELWIAIGRGLAAVHAAGLVHRDLKPENALIGEDGRARLIDFGLVRAVDESGEERAGLDVLAREELETTQRSSSASQRSEGVLEAALTRHGAAVGTPAYMAPEQLRGQPGTQRSDQFSLCLCMVESLVGERPFVGSTEERLAAMAEVEVARLPASVPRRVRAVLRRGLAFAPEQRWPSVDALLDELERAFVSRRRRGLFLGAGLVAVVLSLDLGREPYPEPDRRCAVDPEAFVGIVDDERLPAIRAAFAATELPFAEPSAAAVETELARWTRVWNEERRAACRATRVFGLQSQARLDSQLACFDRARDRVRELSRILAEADAGVLGSAPELLAELPAPASCRAATSSSEPPTTRPELEALATLDRAELLLIAGDQVGASATLARVEAQLDGGGPTSLARLRADALAAEFDIRAQRFEAGFRGLRDVADAAGRAGLADYEASVRVDLAARVVGRWSKPDLERWWLTDAELALARVAGPEDPRAVELARARGLLAQARGDYQESERLLADALVAAETQGLTVLAGYLRMDIGNSLRKRGAFAEARQLYADLIVDDARRWGSEHPRIAEAEHNLGILEVDAGNFARGVAHLERAIALYERAWGPDALGALRSRFTLVHIAISTGRLDEAADMLDALLPRFEGTLGPEHRETAHAYNAAGILRFYAGDYAASIVAYERALAGFVAAHGEDHDDVGLVLCNLGESYVALGEDAKAMQAFDRGLAILERRLGSNHPDLGPALKGRGLLRLAQGREQLAIADLERALALLERSGDEPLELAQTRLALARALRSAGEGGRALVLARRAATDFSQLGVATRAESVEHEFGIP